MRFLKALFFAVILIVVARYLPVYYYSSQFNDFASKAIERTRTVTKLRQSLYDEAELLMIPLRAEDVEIQKNGPTFHLTVNYQVPVDLFFYTDHVKFHVAGAGMVLE
jgi:hypothetical protein